MIKVKQRFQQNCLLYLQFSKFAIARCLKNNFTKVIVYIRLACFQLAVAIVGFLFTIFEKVTTLQQIFSVGKNIIFDIL